MSKKRAALVLGASGSVGQALVKVLAQSGWFDPIVTLVRKPVPDSAAATSQAGRSLREVIVSPMEAGNLERATREAAAALPDDVVGFSVLGVGAGTSRLTLEEHRAVDVVLNGAFARGLKASGKVKHLAFMSAAGANPSASTTGSGAAGGARYNRVKGEAEEAVRQSGPEVVSVLRPAMIIGSQHTPWLLEKTLPLFSFITPGRYKSIRAEQIAQAMAVLGKEPPQASQVYHYPEMVALIEGALSSSRG